ncbi:hypothetical protein NG895_03765 [Aeoliella sp. ICT_H6.2]|uniref:Uncharacterized protein n=1 Tax=Aeoliella straminimaris TaxID=2954799 RepID=A0A9X2JEH5_9BACT|nr:hypothetical protein [Aeoliella straminimaris]MCO6043015.1 hypothetical protein [Aeoliella straminimaris]
MKSVLRLSVVTAIVGLSFGLASDADARCCFLKKLFNRGCCAPTCCEPDPCGCESTPDCGCGAPVASDCGCGGMVVEEGVVVEEGAVPTEAASPSEEMQQVPEPPAEAPEGEKGDVFEGGTEKPAEAAAEGDAAT